MNYPAYAKYKPSGVEWLGEVPGHWEVKRLRHVCRFAYGDSLASEDREDGEVPVYGSNGPVGSHIAANTRRPAIVIGRKGSHGKVNFSAREVFAIDTTYLIDDRYTTNDLRWLFYTLGALGLDAVSKDSAVPGLAREDAYAYLVTTPSFSEQYAIANFLDTQTAKLDTLVTKKRALIEKLKEKRTALISRTVTRGLPPDAARAAGLDPHPKVKPSGIDWLGDVPEHWEVKPLKCGVRFVEGPGIMAADFVDDGVPLLRISSIESRTASLDGCNYLSVELVAARWSHFCVRRGDLLISGSASTGFCSEVDEVTEGAVPYTGIIIIRPVQKVAEKAFIRWFFLSRAFLTQAELARSGSTIQHFGPSHLSQMIVALAPAIEQRVIADFLDRETATIDQMVAKVETAIERLQEYRTALITAAVTGKIDVRGHGAGSGVTATATSKIRMRV